MEYHDRREAGEVLGADVRRELPDAAAVVFALPRGGVPVGLGVARALHAPLDVCVVRKIGAASHPELTIGAIAPGGNEILDQTVVRQLGLTPIEIAAMADRHVEALQRAEHLYRGDRPMPDVRGAVAVIVDDGLATGVTMRAAVAAVRDLEPRSIVVAVPVGSIGVCDEIAEEVGTVVCPWRPESLDTVGKWYRDFRQTSERQVLECLTLAAQDQAALQTALSY